MCVDGGVLSTSRNIHHGCFVRGRNSAPKLPCAPQKWQLSSPQPFDHPSSRLLLWRIPETPVGTRSNAPRFSDVSRTVHSKTQQHFVSGAPHQSCKHGDDLRLLEWIRQAKKNNTFVNVVPTTEKQEFLECQDCGFACEKREQ